MKWWEAWPDLTLFEQELQEHRNLIQWPIYGKGDAMDEEQKPTPIENEETRRRMQERQEREAAEYSRLRPYVRSLSEIHGRPDDEEEESPWPRRCWAMLRGIGWFLLVSLLLYQLDLPGDETGPRHVLHDPDHYSEHAHD